MNQNNTTDKIRIFQKGGAIYFFFALFTAMIGHTLHGSLFWSIMDFFFWTFAWLKWIIYHEVTMATIRQTFSWFFN